MHRRSLSSGRRLAALGAIVILVGCLLPWYVLGGNGGLPELVYRAFDGTGMLTFVAALATLALVTLPYAAGERPIGIDHPMVFALLAVVALVGVVLWIPNIHALDAPGRAVSPTVPTATGSRWSGRSSWRGRRTTSFSSHRPAS